MSKHDASADQSSLKTMSTYANSKDPIKVLIVEDELIVALNLSKQLEGLGFEPVGMASSEDEAVQLALSEAPDVILMDINLESGGSGINAARRINEHCKAPIVYVTAYSSDKVIEMMGSTNPYGYILKPYNIREVKAVISNAMLRYDFESRILQSEQRLQFALEAADLGVLEYDKVDKKIQIDGHDSSMLALGFKKSMPKDVFIALFCDKDANQLKRLLSNSQPFNYRARMKSDSQKADTYVDVYLSHITLRENRVQIGAVKDVSSDQLNIENLKLSHSVIHQMQESLIVLDEHENIKQVNPAFCSLIGVNQESVINRPIGDFLLNERLDDPKPSKVDVLNINKQGQREVTVKKSDGSHIFAIMTVSDLCVNDELRQFIITLTDVSKLVEAERTLSRIAFADALTGFGNRAYLNQVLDHLYKTPTQNIIALLFIDIDSFKNINDTLGHEAGDNLLVEIASRLKRIFRDRDSLVRIGGDEFVVILTGLFDQDALALIGKKVIGLFDEDFTLYEQKVSVSSSIGIAFSDFESFEPKALLKQADSAMYQAKRQGKNTFRFYDEAIANQTRYRIFIEQGLRSALSNHEIMIYLQPVVDQSGKVKSAEALCRWYNHETGFIPPDDFIPVAEESDLIQSLGLRVVHESMLAKKQLNDAGFEDIVININFSEKQLRNKETTHLIEDILKEYELNANQFAIEITESVLHCSASDKTIMGLKKLGFRFALDDFGTGYSALSRLHDYNVDIIKIDRGFIQKLCADAKQTVITRAIINLGRDLGYEIIAEGVETQAQKDALIEMGCASMQGYLFAKPMPIHEFIHFLSTKEVENLNNQY